jgi:hypothetical protein
MTDVYIDAMHQFNLLVERLGVGGGGGDVSITGSLVGAGGLLQGLGVSKVGGAGSVVGRCIAANEVEGAAFFGGGGKEREHLKITSHIDLMETLLKNAIFRLNVASRDVWFNLAPHGIVIS